MRLPCTLAKGLREPFSGAPRASLQHLYRIGRALTNSYTVHDSCGRDTAQHCRIENMTHEPRCRNVTFKRGSYTWYTVTTDHHQHHGIRHSRAGAWGTTAP
eukprot:5649840-Prymnesium_polylepis.1